MPRTVAEGGALAVGATALAVGTTAMSVAVGEWSRPGADVTAVGAQPVSAEREDARHERSDAAATDDPERSRLGSVAMADLLVGAIGVHRSRAVPTHVVGRERPIFESLFGATRSGDRIALALPAWTPDGFLQSTRRSPPGGGGHGRHPGPGVADVSDRGAAKRCHRRDVLAFGVAIAVCWPRWPGDVERRLSCSRSRSRPPLASTSDRRWTSPLAVVVALTVATYSVGVPLDRADAVVGGVGVAVLIAVAVAKDLGADSEINDVAVPALILGTPWLAGLSVRSRHEREAAFDRLRLEQANAAVLTSGRASRATSTTRSPIRSGVIILQARGARRTLQTEPDAAREALDAIETTGTAALAEMRGLVGVLHDDEQPKPLAPPPSLRHVESLVATVREAGLPVELSIEGTPVGLPAGMDASAYRIVQEALTNALAHAGHATAKVVIRYGADDLDLEIDDTGVGPRDIEAGHGLTGMRQRVSFLDGRLEVGPRPGGGFTVRASLPLRTPGT